MYKTRLTSYNYNANYFDLIEKLHDNKASGVSELYYYLK